MALLIRNVLVQGPGIEPSVSQSLLLGIAVILLFPISVYTAGYTAKKIDVYEAGYTQAVWATVFKNVSTVAGLAVLSGLLSLPAPLSLLLIGVLLPIVIYRQVFLSTIRGAIKIWLVVLAVEVVAGTCLVLAAVLFGHWLDEKYDLNSLFAAIATGWHAALVGLIAVPKRHTNRRR